jgi:DNA polymerase-1
MNRLVLIDGNAVLHRAYHAIPPLTAPDGSVVNAVYGFATMLLRLHHDLAPTHMAVAFDRPAPTFRKKLYEGYQSKRPKMEDNLVSQIPKVHEFVDAFAVPIFENDGFEADDVIGTICKIVSKRQSIKASEEKIDQVIIVTGDRDILQLVEGERVLGYLPTKGLSEAKLYRDRDVKERLGVLPKQITDYKGLAGDASDNYPGVEGIGPKTAIALIETFGTVEEVYIALHTHDRRLEKFSTSVLTKLTAGEKMAKMSKDLATIRTNVPLNNDIKKSKIASLDTPQAREIIGKFHFHSLLKRLGGEVEVQKPVESQEKTEETEKSEQQKLF